MKTKLGPQEPPKVELTESEAEQEWLCLGILAEYIPPEPDTAGGASAALYGQLDLGDYREQRKREWAEFLARMNAPEMVERRGTKLTPHGWRQPDNKQGVLK